jgi:hypothetical protein
MHSFLKFIFGMKLYMFQTVHLSIIRSFSLYTQQWYMSYRFADSCEQDQDGAQLYVCMSAALFGTVFATVRQTYTSKALITYAATPPD